MILHLLSKNTTIFHVTLLVRLLLLLLILHVFSTNVYNVQAQQDCFRLELKTDIYPSETYWSLINYVNKTIVYSTTTPYYVVPEYLHTTTYCIDDDDNNNSSRYKSCYQFIIYDTYGDGIVNGLSWDGYYKLYWNNQFIYENYNFNSYNSSSPWFGGTNCHELNDDSIMKSGVPTLAPIQNPSTYSQCYAYYNGDNDIALQLYYPDIMECNYNDTFKYIDYYSCCTSNGFMDVMYNGYNDDDNNNKNGDDNNDDDFTNGLYGFHFRYKDYANQQCKGYGNAMKSIICQSDQGKYINIDTSSIKICLSSCTELFNMCGGVEENNYYYNNDDQFMIIGGDYTNPTSLCQRSWYGIPGISNIEVFNDTNGDNDDCLSIYEERLPYFMSNTLPEACKPNSNNLDWLYGIIGGVFCVGVLAFVVFVVYYLRQKKTSATTSITMPQYGLGGNVGIGSTKNNNNRSSNDNHESSVKVEADGENGSNIEVEIPPPMITVTKQNMASDQDSLISFQSSAVVKQNMASDHDSLLSFKTTSTIGTPKLKEKKQRRNEKLYQLETQMKKVQDNMYQETTKTSATDVMELLTFEERMNLRELEGRKLMGDLSNDEYERLRNEILSGSKK